MYDYFEWFTYNNALFGLVVTPVVITKQFGHFLLLPNLPDLPVDYKGNPPTGAGSDLQIRQGLCVWCFFFGGGEIQVLNKCDEI